MKKEINIRLNANRAKVVNTGYKFASGDKGIVFKIAVDELDTTGTTAKIVFKRSNGTSVESNIAAAENIYSYITLGNEFEVVGPVVADVKLYESEKRVSTSTFIFEVVSDTMDGIGNGTAGYSDALEKMKESMLQAQTEMETLSSQLETLYDSYAEAFGTTGAFNPRGNYSADTSYKVRDLVTYNGGMWICIKNCTGATPGPYSDCWQYFFSQAEIDAIITGAQQVGNAKTLDGHGAEEFAPLADLERYMATLYKGNTEEGIDAIYDSLHTNASNGEWYRARIFHNVSHSVLGGGTWYVEGYRQQEKYGWQSATCYHSGNIVKTFKRALINSTTWNDWIADATTADLANYVTKSDAKVNTRLDAIDGNGKAFLVAQGARGIVGAKDLNSNTTRQISVEPYSTKPTDKEGILLQCYDGANWNVYYILHSGNISDYALPNTGGTVATNGTTPLKLKNNSADALYLQMLGKSGVLGYFAMSGKDKPSFISATGAVSDILHTSNKPKGTYTGNGDATERMIAVSSLCNGVVIRMVSSTDFAIVTPSGYIAKSGNSVVVGSDAYSNSSGFVLKTVSALFNTSGTTYNYFTL